MERSIQCKILESLNRTEIHFRGHLKSTSFNNTSFMTLSKGISLTYLTKFAMCFLYVRHRFQCLEICFCLTKLSFWYHSNYWKILPYFIVIDYVFEAMWAKYFLFQKSSSKMKENFSYLPVI